MSRSTKYLSVLAVSAQLSIAPSLAFAQREQQEPPQTISRSSDSRLTTNVAFVAFSQDVRFTYNNTTNPIIRRALSNAVENDNAMLELFTSAMQFDLASGRYSRLQLIDRVHTNLIAYLRSDPLLSALSRTQTRQFTDELNRLATLSSIPHVTPINLPANREVALGLSTDALGFSTPVTRPIPQQPVSLRSEFEHALIVRGTARDAVSTSQLVARVFSELDRTLQPFVADQAERSRIVESQIRSWLNDPQSQRYRDLPTVQLAIATSLSPPTQRTSETVREVPVPVQSPNQYSYSFTYSGQNYVLQTTSGPIVGMYDLRLQVDRALNGASTLTITVNGESMPIRDFASLLTQPQVQIALGVTNQNGRLNWHSL